LTGRFGKVRLFKPEQRRGSFAFSVVLDRPIASLSIIDQSVLSK